MLTALGLCVAASGCAVPWGMLGDHGKCQLLHFDDQKLLEELASSASCCSTFGEMRFAPIEALPKFVTPFGDQKVQMLAADAPVFDFPEGRSRFLAFVIPIGSRSTLIIESRRAGWYATECRLVGGISSRHLVPSVVFLDADRNVLMSSKASRWDFERNRYVLRFRFVIPTGARYAVAYADPREYGKTFEAGEMPATAMVVHGLAFPLIVPGSGYLATPVSTGLLSISLASE